MHLTKAVFGIIRGVLKKENDKIVRVNPDKFWRKQQALKYAWNRWGRLRTENRLAHMSVKRALKASTINRPVYRNEIRKLRLDRIDAAAAEHGFDSGLMLEGLARSQILLDKKVLAELAIYEPRTFESLADIAKKKLEQEEINNPSTPEVKNVLTRDLL